MVHRAFHALPPTLNSPKGVPTNAVFGFTSVLLKMIKDLKPDYIAATFDLAAPTFRHEEFAEYKEHRVKAPDELHAQVPIIKEILAEFGIPIYEKPGFEADDLIGTISEKSKKIKDLQTVIMTGDLDTLQLVEDKKVVVFTLRKGVTDTVIYDEEEVYKRYGLKPDQLNDFKGLKGDPSDNIPGVPGVGEKTASTLIQKFGSLEKLYDGILKKDKALSKKLIQKLIENKDMAFFSKKLATIVRSVEIEFNLDKVNWMQNLDRLGVERLFRELGLYSLIKRLDEISIISQGQMELPETKGGDLEAKVTDLKTIKEIKEVLDQVKAKNSFSLNLNSDIFSLYANGRNFSASWPMIVENKELMQSVKDILEGDGVTKIGYDFKELAKFLLSYKIELNGPGFDTKLAAYLLNSDRKDYSIEKIYFDEFQELLNTDGKDMPYFIDKIKNRQDEHLKTEKLGWLFENIEIPTSRVLAEMELRGVLIDLRAIAKLSKSVSKETNSLEKEIYKLAGTEFNINSPQQLSQILFDPPPGGLGLKGKVSPSSSRLRKTSKGALSTAASELEKLADEHPIAEKILKYREVQKLKTTYIEPFPTLVSKASGRLHTTYNQTGTTTGRLASQDPNLQNIPTRTELGQEFRKAFVASPGYKLVSFDYSQLELRIAAHISQDAKMISIFKRGEDIHNRTAAEIFGVKPEMVDKNMRRDAKVLNFGVLYGMGILGFQRASGVSRERAREFIDRYFREFPGVAGYMNEMKVKARKDGFVSTIFGRRRWFPEIKSSMPQVVSQAERMAINHPIQGTAADLMKLAMVKIFDHLHDSDSQDDVFLLLQIHDELLFEIKENLVKNVADKIRDIMENVHKFDVPLVVDVKRGYNWAEMEEI